MVGQHAEMCWQIDWSGPALRNKHILVFEDELDKPQRQLGFYPIQADPPPIRNARVEPYAIDERWPMLMEAGTSPGDEMPVYLEASTIVGGTGTPTISFSLEISTEP